MKYFLVGVKGVGMTGLATLYKEWGFVVRGSDTEEEFFTDRILCELGIQITDFDTSHITKDTDRVVYSSAYGAEHVQVARAREFGITTLSYIEALAEIFNTRRGILVTGTHGKTTSAAMLARVLEGTGLNPTAIVGGELIEWGRTARAGLGNPTAKSLMVAEGDEYQAKILAMHPQVLLLTNIEYDHPDFYPTEESYRDVFRKLLKQMPEDGIVVAHESLRDFVGTICRAKTIYFSYLTFDAQPLKVWGEHNRTNAAGVLAVAEALGARRDSVLNTLANFRGTRRRMELYTDENADIVVMDDYAHHPTEIRATLNALREHYKNRRIIALFQPHTYSRTKALLDDFASAFGDADVAVILEIYASAREREKTTSGRELFQKVQKFHKNAVFASTVQDAAAWCKTNASKGDVIVTLGAGDVWQAARALQ